MSVPPLISSSISQCPDEIAERITTLLIVPELVERRAGGREQDNIAGPRRRRRMRHRGGQIARPIDRDGIADLVRERLHRFADQIGALDMRSEENTSELQSLMRISSAVF